MEILPGYHGNTFNGNHRSSFGVDVLGSALSHCNSCCLIQNGVILLFIIFHVYSYTMFTDVTCWSKQLLPLLLCLCLAECVPIDEQPLSGVGQRLLQNMERTMDVTPSGTTVAASGVPHITGTLPFVSHGNYFKLALFMEGSEC